LPRRLFGAKPVSAELRLRLGDLLVIPNSFAGQSGYLPSTEKASNAFPGAVPKLVYPEFRALRQSIGRIGLILRRQDIKRHRLNVDIFGKHTRGLWIWRNTWETSTMRVTAATFRKRSSGESHRCPLRHLFLFIGAEPNASWLNGCVDVDAKGFVITGATGAESAGAKTRPLLSLETSRRGVFAIGDVRAGSTKRVGAAIGEGAAVVAQIHSVLARI
jgi:thioredoxin reductase